MQLIVGREETLLELDRRIDAAGKGRGSAVALVGDAGIGKSTILSHCIRGARLARMASIWVRCPEGAEPVPFATLSDLAVELLAVAADRGIDAASVFESEKAGTSLLLAEYSDPDQIESARRLPYLAQQRAAYSLLTRLLRAVSSAGSLLLAVDDIHRSDEFSAGALMRLVPGLQSSNTLVVCGLRPAGESSPVWLHEFVDRVATHGWVEQLCPLTEREVGALIEALHQEESANGEPIDPEAVYAESGGHPLIVRWLIEGATDVDRFVAKRLALISTGDRDLLVAIATFGAAFGETLLDALAAELPIKAPLKSLRSLIGATLVSQAAPDTYRIFHDTLRMAILASITREEANRFHGVVGRVLADGSFVGAARHDSYVARHLVCSDREADILAGVQYGLRAARGGLLQSSWGESRKLLELMLERAGDLVDEITRADIEYGIAQSILMAPPEYPVWYKAIDYLRSARETYFRNGAAERMIDPEIPIVLAEANPGLGARVLSAIPADHPLRGVCEYQASHEFLHVRPLAQHLLERARTAVSAGEYRWLEPAVVAQLAYVNHMDRLDDLAEEQIEWALEAGALRDSGSLGVTARFVHACILRKRGSIDSATARLNQAVRLARDARGVPSTMIEFVDMARRRRDVAAADWAAATAEPLSEEAWPLRPVIAALYLTGQIERGDEQLHRIIPGIEDDPDAGPWVGLMCAAAIAVRARCAEDSDYLDQAIGWIAFGEAAFPGFADALMQRLPEMARRVSPDAPTTLSRYSLAYFQTRVAIVKAGLGFAAKDARMLGDARDALLDLPPGVVDRHKELRALGLCHWGLRDHTKALHAFSEAHEWCEFYRDIPAIAWNLADRSWMLRATGQSVDAERCAERSLRFARTHGLLPLERRLISQSAQLPGLDDLTAREREVLDLVSRGFADKEIAAALGISPHTASNHVRHILTKLHCANRAEAAALFLRNS